MEKQASGENGIFSNLFPNCNWSGLCWKDVNTLAAGLLWLTQKIHFAAAATRVEAPQARGRGPLPCATCDCCQRQGPGPGRSLQVPGWPVSYPAQKIPHNMQTDISMSACICSVGGFLQNRISEICSPAPTSYANSPRPAMTMGNFCQHWNRGRVLPAFASRQTKEKFSGNKSWHSQEKRRRKIHSTECFGVHSSMCSPTTLLDRS